MSGLFTSVTNKQGFTLSNNYIKICTGFKQTKGWLEALLINSNNSWVRNKINKEALLVIGWRELYLFRMKV